MLSYREHEYIAYTLVIVLSVFLGIYTIQKEWEVFENKSGFRQKILLLLINVFFGIAISTIAGNFVWAFLSGYRDICSRPLFILAPAISAGMFGAVISTLLLVLFPTKLKEVFGSLYSLFFVSIVMIICLLIFEPFSRMDVRTSIFVGILNGVGFGLSSGFSSGFILRQYENYRIKINSFIMFLIISLILISIYIIWLYFTCLGFRIW